jgi:hypothetical protein
VRVNARNEKEGNLQFYYFLSDLSCGLGHSAKEEGTASELINATDKYADL